MRSLHIDEARIKPLTLAAVLEGATYLSKFGCHALSMPPNQATQWSDADLESCDLSPDEVQDMRARLRAVGIGMTPPSCDREAG